MKNSFFNYLAEASFCLVVFSALYRLLLARLTYFVANRAYLLGALVAAVVLPLLVWPGVAAWLVPAAVAPEAGALPFQWTWRESLGAAGAVAVPGATLGSPAWLPLLAGGIYLAGAAFRTWGLVRDLRWVQQLVRHHPRTRHGRYWLVRVGGAPLPAFSFGRFVFLSAAHEELSTHDRHLLLLHEEVHVRQHHTYDLLLAELIGMLLWFNPLVKYLKTSLKDVHEYLADHAVARASNAQQYGRLLVRLAAQQPPVALVHALSSKQIFSRIFTLTQPPSSPMQKLRFLLVVPVVGLAWLATSAFSSASSAVDAEGAAGRRQPRQTVAKSGGAPIGRLSWQGNTLVSSAKLSQVLGLKTGDAYDSATVEKRLGYDPKGDVGSLYMDQGYMFFSVTPTATRQPNGTVDLAFTVSEGPQLRVRNLIFVGNKRVSTADLTKLVPLRAGELFSRAKLIQSQQKLAQTGYFEPREIGINPKPVMKTGGRPDQTDVEFVLVEKK